MMILWIILLMVVEIINVAVTDETPFNCPGLEPPNNGILRCESMQQLLKCTATCNPGFEFGSNQSVVQRLCNRTTHSWTEDSSLPSCIKVTGGNICQEELIDGSNSFSYSNCSSAEYDVQSTLLSWQANADDIAQYIEVDLGIVYNVTGISISGDGYGNYIKLFRLLFSLNGDDWITYSDPQQIDKFFAGNFNDNKTTVTRLFNYPQVARYVRLNPLLWHGQISLGFNLLGCASNYRCRALPPPERGAINCERNKTHLICIAYCLKQHTFPVKGSAIARLCNEETGVLAESSFPACDLETIVNPQQNVSIDCIQYETECEAKANGNYQYCGNCHYFSTCSEGYFYVRPCPEHLQYSQEGNLCNYKSSTCSDRPPFR